MNDNNIIVTLSNGLRVANFSSNHDFKFVDIFTLPGVSYKDNFLSKPELKVIYERGKKK